MIQVLIDAYNAAGLKYGWTDQRTIEAENAVRVAIAGGEAAARAIGDAIAGGASESQAYAQGQTAATLAVANKADELNLSTAAQNIAERIVIAELKDNEADNNLTGAALAADNAKEAAIIMDAATRTGEEKTAAYAQALNVFEQAIAVENTATNTAKQARIDTVDALKEVAKIATQTGQTELVNTAVKKVDEVVSKSLVFSEVSRPSNFALYGLGALALLLLLRRT